MASTGARKGRWSSGSVAPALSLVSRLCPGHISKAQERGLSEVWEVASVTVSLLLFGLCGFLLRESLSLDAKKENLHYVSVQCQLQSTDCLKNQSFRDSVQGND